MKAECTEHRGRFSDYLDGELNPTECAALEAHLEECADCRAELDLWRRTVRAVSDLPSVTAPDGFSTRVLERLDARKTRPGVTRIFVRALPVAAMFLLVVGLTFMVRRDGEVGRVPAPERLAMVREKAAGDAVRPEGAAEEHARAVPELEETLPVERTGVEKSGKARAGPAAPSEEWGQRLMLERAGADRAAGAMERKAATPLATAERMGRPVGAREPERVAFLFTQSAETPEEVRQTPQQVLTVRWRDPAALMHRAVALANDYGTNVVLELKEEGAADIQVEIAPSRYDDLLRELAAMTPPENQMLSNTLAAREEFFQAALERYRDHRRKVGEEMQRAMGTVRGGAPEAESTAPRALAMRGRAADRLGAARRDAEEGEVRREGVEAARQAVGPVSLQISIRRSADAR